MAYLDGLVGEMVATLTNADMWDETLMVFSSGESRGARSVVCSDILVCCPSADNGGDDQANNYRAKSPGLP